MRKVFPFGRGRVFLVYLATHVAGVVLACFCVAVHFRAPEEIVNSVVVLLAGLPLGLATLVCARNAWVTEYLLAGLCAYALYVALWVAGVASRRTFVYVIFLVFVLLAVGGCALGARDSAVGAL